MKTKVFVLGGGIAGSAAFAILTQRPELDVTLVEAASALGTGTTAKNNGRCHSGASGVFTDTPDVTRRKIAGSAILRELPLRWETSSSSRYVCRDRAQAHSFRDACRERGIAATPETAIHDDRWLGETAAETIFRVPEPSFDPVETTELLAAVGAAQGGHIRFDTQIKFLRTDRGSLIIGSEQIEFEADAVLDVTSKFAGSISVDERPRLVEIEWYRWPIMALPADCLPNLDSVITSMDDKLGLPSVIPHGEWITFDAKTKPEQVSGPVAYPAENPSRISKSSSQEAAILAGAQRFPPLHGVLGELRDKIRVFYGIHGRRKGDGIGSDICRTYWYPDIPNYVLRQGGLATTAILDAVESAAEVESRLCLEPIASRPRLNALAASLLTCDLPVVSSRMLYARGR